MLTTHRHRPPGGFSLVEVLVTVLILAFGLLGLAALKIKIQTSEVESFQRSQALLILEDMVARIKANRANAYTYVADGVGTGTAPCATGATQKDKDLFDWCTLLRGSAETIGSNKIGAMIGGQGCIEVIPAGAAVPPYTVRVSVAWQGLTATDAPSLACGQDDYGNDDKLRRVVSSLAMIGKLD